MKKGYILYAIIKNKKSVFLFLLTTALVISGLLEAKIYYPKVGYSQSQTPIFAFDMDKLLVNRGVFSAQLLGFLTYFWSTKEISCADKWRALGLIKVLKTHGKKLAELAEIFDEQVAIDYATKFFPLLKKKIATGETLGDRLLKVHLESAVWNDKTVTILKELQDTGYPTAIATNHSGDTVFYPLLKTPECPLELEKFAEIFTSNSAPLRPGQVHCKKPDPEYFNFMDQRLQKKLNPSTNPAQKRMIIFIDDSEDNARACPDATENCIGVHFDLKNPNAVEQLRNDLADLGTKIARKNSGK